jgi:hypothetical protein
VQCYTQVVAVEQAFKNLKGDRAIRPIFHQNHLALGQDRMKVGFDPALDRCSSAGGRRAGGSCC